MSDGISAAEDQPAVEDFSWDRGPGDPWDNKFRKDSPKAELDTLLFIDSMGTYNICTISERSREGIISPPDVAWRTSRAASYR